MCIGGGSPSIPAPPPPPPVPPPPPPAPTPVNLAVKTAQQSVRKAAALAGNRDNTLLTGGQGLTTPASTSKKTFLGE